MRRTGKSVILKQIKDVIQKERKLKDEEIIFINFEDYE
jgi:predicted AAA+ superfamily ATPase